MRQHAETLHLAQMGTHQTSVPLLDDFSSLGAGSIFRPLFSEESDKSVRRKDYSVI